MSALHILIIEDEPDWGLIISRMLKHMASEVPLIAVNHTEAVQYVNSTKFDLVIMDLALPGEDADPRSDIERGFDLLKELRASTYNETCALLVVSGQYKNKEVVDAMRRYKVHSFWDKDDFDENNFLGNIGDALLMARIKRADKADAKRYRLTIHFDEHQIQGSELSGPVTRPFHIPNEHTLLNVPEYVRRTNNMNQMVVNADAEIWRDEAFSLGSELFKNLTGEKRVTEGLATTTKPNDVWLQLSGPANGIGVPFELLHDGNEYLVFKHIVTRRIVPASNSHKLVSFQKFIRSFQGGQVPLRILLVGVDSDQSIPYAEQEVESLELAMKNELKSLGIRNHIKSLVGAKATRANVSSALRDGNYHFFHYSGHGYYDKEQPETSGLTIFCNDFDDTTCALTASDLASLTRNAELRFAYLSCCLGSCTAPHLRRGDFFGIFDALARADVPMVLGYRWEIGDSAALRMAELFYKKLWRTLSPGQALLETRIEMSEEGLRRDNDAWASPVLLMQNA